MKKILLIFLSFLALDVNAQIDTVLFKSFTDMEVSESWTLIGTNPVGYEEWIFKTCYSKAINGISKIQIGNSETRGSITSPTLLGLLGNARITMEVFMVDDNAEIYVSNDGSGGVNSKNQQITPVESWEWINPVLLRGGDATTQIVTYSKAKSGSASKRFQLRNFLVCNMGDNIYWESFDKISGIGGNDRYFGTEGANLFPDNTEFDYTNSEKSHVRRADKCVRLEKMDGGKGSFVTGIIPFLYPNGSKAFVAFKVVKVDDSTPELTVNGVSLESSDFGDGEWSEKTLEITDITSNMKLTFEGDNCFLDDICVWEVGYMSDTEDNTAALAHTTVENIMLNRRLGAGYWNTLCLPFDFSLDGELPEEMKGLTIELMRLTDVQDGVFVFTPTTAVSAGEPFLVRVSETVENPTFRHVQVTQPTPVAKTFGSYQMVGAYNPVGLDTDGTHLFLGSDGELYRPTDEDCKMNGLRAYFVVPSGSGARVSLFDDPAGIVKKTQTDNHQPGAFDLTGRPVKVSTNHNGIYIEKGKKRAW